MRPRVLVAPDPKRPKAPPPRTEAVVVGGGIAGVSAAVVLAERGVAVTLLEAAPTLGGRLGAWPHTLPDGTPQVVEHGFHAFFRHYYTWRDILRRIDPDLAFLRPIGGYPVISRSWPPEDLTGLPGAPPLNLIALFARSPSLGLRDLLGSDQALAGQLLAYDAVATTAAFDDVPAARFLAELGMSDRAQAMLFEAFARSFFARPAALSAAELIAMFHYYFLGNPEGIGFDAPDTDYLTCIWGPLRTYLERRGVRFHTGTPVRALHPADRWRVETEEGAFETRHVVLAVDPGALKTLVGGSSVPAELARQAELLEEHYERVIERLEGAGYTWYETANFCRPGFMSQHNRAYWLGRDYLGIGVGAVSTLGDERRVTTPRIAPYLEAIADGRPAPAKVELLTPEIRRRERLMLGLRLAEGVERASVEGAVDDDALALLATHGVVAEADGRIVLERRGRLLVHDVVARLSRDDGRP